MYGISALLYFYILEDTFNYEILLSMIFSFISCTSVILILKKML